MKCIILAGGSGSRLFPLTLAVSKQLQSVYDKPMVYYPLTTMIECGLREFCLISTPQHLPQFRELLGDGSAWGISIQYREQTRPQGIAHAFLVAQSFIEQGPVALILGDNIFHGGREILREFTNFSGGATVFGYHVPNPERYGVVEFDAQGLAISIEEKPKHPKSNYVVPGLYLYDNQVLGIARELKPSARGEFEISDVNAAYLQRKQLRVCRLGRGTAWFDTGSGTSLYDAATYVHVIETRQGTKIGCPEEAAFRRGFISLGQFEALIDRMPGCEYRSYLFGVLSETKYTSAAAGREFQQ
jgi:glucose-1-phosphate thymidylyltransferase